MQKVMDNAWVSEFQEDLNKKCWSFIYTINPNWLLYFGHSDAEIDSVCKLTSWSYACTSQGKKLKCAAGVSCMYITHSRFRLKFLRHFHKISL